jgi:hypothetical protein
MLVELSDSEWRENRLVEPDALAKPARVEVEVIYDRTGPIPLI